MQPRNGFSKVLVRGILLSTCSIQMSSYILKNISAFCLRQFGPIRFIPSLRFFFSAGGMSCNTHICSGFIPSMPIGLHGVKVLARLAPLGCIGRLMLAAPVQVKQLLAIVVSSKQLRRSPVVFYTSLVQLCTHTNLSCQRQYQVTTQTFSSFQNWLRVREKFNCVLLFQRNSRNSIFSTDISRYY